MTWQRALGGFAGLGQAASVGGLSVPHELGLGGGGSVGDAGEVPLVAPLAAADGNLPPGWVSR